MFILDNDTAADIAAANFSIVDEMVDLHDTSGLRTHGVGLGMHLQPPSFDETLAKMQAGRIRNSQSRYSHFALSHA